MLMNRFSQKGMTIVELLVSLTLGVVVLGGMYSLFSVSQQTTRVQSNVAGAQERANFALELIAEDLRRAGNPGYWSGGRDPFGIQPRITGVGVVGPFFEDDGGRYDTLVVSRRAWDPDPDNEDPLLQDSESDCTGAMVLDDDDDLVQIYFVEDRELKCRSLNSGRTVTVIDNVDAFQVLYGIDTRPGPCQTVNPALSAQDQLAECLAPTMYVRADELQNAFTLARNNFSAANEFFTNDDRLGAIKTVQLALLVSTDAENVINPEMSRDRTFFFLNQFIAHGLNLADFEDGRPRFVSMRTVTLRQAWRGP